MYCSNCGENISNKAEVCPKCGVRPFRVKNYCYNCGEKVRNQNQEICTSCGVSLHNNSISSADAKEPWLIALLSFFITGLGQIVAGQIKKGIAMLIVSVVLGAFSGGFSALFTIPISTIDGYLIAKKIKSGQQVEEWEFF